MIRITTDNDVDFIAACLKDKSEEFCSQCGYGNRFFMYPITSEQILNFQKTTHADSYFFTITDGDIKIGSVELMRDGNIARFLIAEEFRGKGYGTEALHVLCRYAFDELKMAKVSLTVFDFNVSALRCYTKAGFMETRREIRDNGWVAIYMEKTNWLDTIKSEIIEITETAAYEYWKPITGYTKPYFNHRLEHVKQVEIEALRLMETYGGDEDIILAAVWLHDRYKPQFEGVNHGAKAADWIAENLAATGFPADKVAAVEYAVRNHQGLEISGLDTVEAKILWDSDQLSHTGSSFVTDMMYLNMLNTETMTVEKIIPFLKEYMEDEPKLKLKERFYFPESIELFKEKRAITNMFINGLIHRL